MKVTIEGHTTLSGNPATILYLMQEARIFDELTGDEYIESIKDTAQRCFDITLNVKGNDYQERAESLLREMAKAKMIKIEEE